MALTTDTGLHNVPNMKTSKKIGLILALTTIPDALILACVYLHWTTRIVAGPMLQMVGPTEFSVAWQVNRWGSGQLTVTQQETTVAKVAARQEDDRFVATVTGLKPGGKYDYRISHNMDVFYQTLGGPWSCSTDPGPQASLRLLVFGDSGTGSRSQYALAEKMATHPIDLIIHTGDLVYPGGELQDYPAKFFQPYAQLLPQAPFMPVLGNHDVHTANGEPLLKTFILPKNGPTGKSQERHYWFDNACARFVAIDSETDEMELRGFVAPWLKKVFSTAERRWRFVFFHYPPYTACAKYPPNAKIQRTLVPAMEQAGVDVVFNGHCHLYERTKPILNGQVVSDDRGIIYIVTGAGGANRYALAPATSRPAFSAAGFDEDFSFTRVDLKPNALDLKQIDLRGRTVDQLTLNRGPRAGLPPATTRASR